MAHLQHVASRLRQLVGITIALGLMALVPMGVTAGTEGGDPNGIDIVHIRIVKQVCTDVDEENAEDSCVESSDVLDGEEISYTVSYVSSGDATPGEFTTSLIVGADGQGELTFEAGLFNRYFTICEEVPAGVTEIAVGADLTPTETDVETGCVTFEPGDIYDNNGLSVTFFNAMGDDQPSDPVDDLPDTGAGAAASDSWPGGTGVALGLGALLLTLTGVVIARMPRRTR
jgi:hypothetical protein